MFLTLTLFTKEDIFAQTTTHGSIGVVLENGRKNEIIKYIYKDLSKAMKRTYNKNITIDFININDADESIFSHYDVIMAVNQRNRETLNRNIKTFVESNKDKTTLLTVAFIPRRGRKLSMPQSVDVLSSPSAEDPASAFIKGKVALTINTMLHNK